MASSPQQPTLHNHKKFARARMAKSVKARQRQPSFAKTEARSRRQLKPIGDFAVSHKIGTSGSAKARSLAKDEYIVEAITDHKIANNGSLVFHVKWKGFEKTSDMTWEPEKHLRNCVVLGQYFDGLGGRHQVLQDLAVAGREDPGKSVWNEASTPTESQQQAHVPPSAEWTRPVGLWEKDISSIDACEVEGGGKLVVYVTWKNGSKTKHRASAIYEHCPQKMLQFYERHVTLT